MEASGLASRLNAPGASRETLLRAVYDALGGPDRPGWRRALSREMNSLLNSVSNEGEIRDAIYEWSMGVLTPLADLDERVLMQRTMEDARVVPAYIMANCLGMANVNPLSPTHRARLTTLIDQLYLTALSDVASAVVDLGDRPPAMGPGSTTALGIWAFHPSTTPELRLAIIKAVPQPRGTSLRHLSTLPGVLEHVETVETLLRLHGAQLGEEDLESLIPHGDVEDYRALVETASRERHYALLDRLLNAGDDRARRSLTPTPTELADWLQELPLTSRHVAVTLAGQTGRARAR